jgi:hypothetical protein
MADMPFTCLSAGSVWRLLWLLQLGQGQPIDLLTLPPVEKCKEDMKGTTVEGKKRKKEKKSNIFSLSIPHRGKFILSPHGFEARTYRSRG